MVGAYALVIVACFLLVREFHGHQSIVDAPWKAAKLADQIGVLH